MSTRQNPPEFWETLFATALPKTHLYAAAAVATALVLLLVMAPSRDVSAYRDANLLEIQIPNPDSLYQELNRQIAEIGRASCRESVEIQEVAIALKKKTRE